MVHSTITDRIVCSGALFYSKATKRILLLQKAHGKHAGNWGLVGGTHLDGESILEGLTREVKEEIGFNPQILKTIPLETFVSNDKVFHFHTYLCVVKEEFLPILSDEHIGWCWANLDNLPKPVHQGLRNSFTNKTIKAKLKTVFDLVELI